MARTNTACCKNIGRLVLFVFVFQCLLPADFGFYARSWHWSLGPGAARADTPPPPAFPVPPADPNSPEYLKATPDADSEDPYIVRKAAELNHDPARIFAFVRDRIGYESYKGSLRGARGTLWSQAGNSLDQASLMIALLRASGVPARYAAGTLADAEAGTLIRSMFSPPLRLLGCLSPGAPTADPASDPALLTEAREHYWVEFGSGFAAADPSFPGAAMGQTFAAAQSEFVEVPSGLRHTVTFRIEAETYSQIGALFGFGSGLSSTPVLTQTFATVELVGKPVTLGQFVDSDSLSSVFAADIHTYSPFVLVGLDAADPASDHVYRGTAFQEAFTNFPLGTTVLTGLFAHVSLTDPAGGTRTYDKTLFDRIGFPARNSASNAQVSAEPGHGPSLGANDLMTVNVLPGLQDESIIGTYGAVNDGMLARAAAIAPQLTDSAAPSPEEAALRQEAAHLSRDLMINTQRVLAATFARSSDLLADRFATLEHVKPFFDSPRLLVAYSRVGDAGNGATQVRVGFDLLKDDIRVLTPAGQTPAAAVAYRFNRGLAEAQIESQLLSRFAASRAPDPGVVSNVQVGATDILMEARNQGMGTAVLAAGNAGRLDTLDLSPEAKARIGQALSAGRIVMVPEHPVDIGGESRIAWLEAQADGTLVDVMEDGGHQALVEYSANYGRSAAQRAAEREITHYFIGFFTGWTAGQLVFLIGYSISGLKISPDFTQFASITATSLYDWILTEVFASAVITDPVIFAGFQAGLNASGIFWLTVGAFDPPLPAALVGGSVAPAPAPGGVPGVAVEVAPDTVYTVPVGDAQAPTAFRALIRNTGPADDTYILALSGAPPGFTLLSSLPSVRIPAGGEAEVGVCAVPTGPLPVPGSGVSLRLDVSSATDPGITAGATESFTVPELHAVELSADPASPGAIPGTPVAVNLAVKSVGNAAEDVAFSVDAPAGLAVSPLNGATLPAGGSSGQTLLLTPDAGAPLNTTLTATVTATFGPAGSPRTRTLSIPVLVAAPGAKAIAEASAAAGQLGQPDLAARLADLGRAMNKLVENPADAAARSQAEAAVDSIVGRLAADPVLSAFTGELTAARAALAAADTPAEMLASLNDLGTALQAFGTATADLARHGVTAFLSPNRQEARPGIAASFELRLANTGTEPTTYDLAFGSLPADTTGAFSQPSVTLAPGQSSTGLTVSLTRNATTELLPAAFRVRVTVDGVPGPGRTVEGSLTVRNEFVSVAAVTADPPFADPGTAVNVSARLLNAVNRARDARVGYVVKDEGGETIHTSPEVPANLTLQTALTDVALGTLDTTGFPDGSYILEAAVSEADGTPIPGATGSGNLLIGSPVAATLASAPAALPAGDGTVGNSLSIGSRLSLPPLAVKGQLPVEGGTRSVAVSGDTAYLCGASGLLVADVQDPENPALAGTVDTGIYSGCRVQGDLLVATKGSFNVPFQLRVYSIENDPRVPVLLGSSPDLPASLLTDLLVTPTHAFVSQLQRCHFLPSMQIYRQGGDFESIALNLNDPADPTAASPALVKSLYGRSNDPQISGCGLVGGDHHVWRIADAGPATLLIAGTTVTGANTRDGTGLIEAIDVSDPAHFSVASSLPIPGTVHSLGVAVDGDRALVTGSEGGWLPNVAVDGLLQGNLVLTLLDVADPRNPQILRTHRTAIPAHTFWSSMTRQGSGRFAFSSLVEDGKPPRLFIIDINDIDRPVIGQTEIPSELLGMNSLESVGSLLYTASDAGLLIYSQPEPPSLPVTASVRVPHDAGAGVVPGSFDTAPTGIVAGAGFDTLVWNFDLPTGTSRSFHWSTAVSGLQPGEARQTSLGGTVDFTFSGTPGQVPLAPTVVAGESILGVDPATQTVRPGQTARYALTLRNPAASPVVYRLAVQGIDPAWVTLSPEAGLGASEEATLDLVVSVPPFTPESVLGLTVAATGTGAQGSAVAELAVQGEAVAPAGLGIARGVLIGLAPSAATAGQGTGARYRVRLTNTGSATESFDLGVSVPPGFAGQFDRASLDVPPGLGNFREVELILTPAPNSPPTDYPFSVQARFAATGHTGSTAQGLVTVVDAGVSLAFESGSGAPGDILSLRVTNTGTVEDTFALALGGPGGLVASLAAGSLHLAPGASDVVAIALGGMDFALPGNPDLFAVATSGYDGAVQAIAKAALNVPASRGLTAAFEPAAAALPAPGRARFLLRVRNTGNAEEEYSAEIVSVSGPLAATLQGLDGNPTRLLPLFRLPALAAGAIGLDADLQGYAGGSVTVKVVSLSEAGPEATATAILGTTAEAPVAEAGPDRNVPVGTPSALDGSASRNSGPGLLAFAWSFDQVPPGSRLADGDIVQRDQPRASFTPDVPGLYRLRLVVGNGQLDSAPDFVSVTAFAANVPPNADAGRDREVAVGDPVELDGGGSEDPDDGPGPLSFRWTLLDLPAGSRASIAEPDRPRTSMTPDLAGDYRIGLEVSDGAAADSAELRITAEAGNVPPVADAGPDQTIELGARARLDGSASRDPDGGPESLAYAWRFAALPAGSRLSDADLKPDRADGRSPAAAFRPDVTGQYLMQLQASDGLATGSDGVLIEVRDLCTTALSGTLRPGARYRGTRGNDAVMATTGKAVLKGRKGNDQLYGGDGNDKLLGGPGHDLLCGLAGNDTVLGGPGQDRLGGGEGRDRLRGGAGNDLLYGGPGDDLLSGGPGADVYDFGAAGAGRDTIRGFDRKDVLIFRDANDDGRVDAGDVAIADSRRGAVVSPRDGSGDQVLIRRIKARQLRFVSQDGTGGPYVIMRK